MLTNIFKYNSKFEGSQVTFLRLNPYFFFTVFLTRQKHSRPWCHVEMQLKGISMAVKSHLCAAFSCKENVREDKSDEKEGKSIAGNKVLFGEFEHDTHASHEHLC